MKSANIIVGHHAQASLWVKIDAEGTKLSERK